MSQSKDIGPSCGWAFAGINVLDHLFDRVHFLGRVVRAGQENRQLLGLLDSARSFRHAVSGGIVRSPHNY